jgi:hypothetical protein
MSQIWDERPIIVVNVARQILVLLADDICEI